MLFKKDLTFHRLNKTKEMYKQVLDIDFENIGWFFKAIDGQATFRMRHFMGDKGKVFDLIVQRSVVTGQVELD
jgi:hypothetical protein